MNSGEAINAGLERIYLEFCKPMMCAGTDSGKVTWSYKEVAPPAAHKAHDSRKGVVKVARKRNGYLEIIGIEGEEEATSWAVMKRMGDL